MITDTFETADKFAWSMVKGITPNSHSNVAYPYFDYINQSYITYSTIFEIKNDRVYLIHDFDYNLTNYKNKNALSKLIEKEIIHDINSDIKKHRIVSIHKDSYNHDYFASYLLLV